METESEKRGNKTNLCFIDSTHLLKKICLINMNPTTFEIKPNHAKACLPRIQWKVTFMFMRHASNSVWKAIAEWQ